MAEPVSTLSLDENVAPIPPRFRWLKRILAAVGVLILALVGLRLWWGYVAERRLQACLAACRAAGEPVEIEDFAVPPVPDEENGAYYLRLAAAKTTQPAELTQEDYERAFDLEYWPASADAVRLIIRANREALAAVRQARQQTRSDWGYRLSSPLIATMLPGLSERRKTTKLALAAAHCAHADGNDAETVELLRDALGIARHMGTMEPFLIVYLVQVAIDTLATERVDRVVCDLDVQQAHLSSRPGPAPPEAVRALIAELLDESHLKATWHRAMCGERLESVDTARVCSNPAGPGIRALGSPVLPIARAHAVLFGPVWTLDALRSIDRCTGVMNAGDSSNFQLALPLIPVDATPDSLLVNIAPFVFGGPSHGYETVRHHFRVLALRRLAALTLAIRLYEVEHGARPAELTALVPDYLPAVPLDPFDLHDAPLRYAPDRPSPAVYSVGPDGLDDGGSPAYRQRGSVDWRELDIAFFLNGYRPTAQLEWKPSSRPASR